MDKKDILYLVAALAIVLVIALVIKPLATGQPINTGIPIPTTQQPVTIVPAQTATGLGTIPLTTPTPAPTTVLTPVPTWNPKSTQSIGFVNSSVYGISSNQSTITGTKFNDTGLDTNMTTFATIASSTGSSGTTSIMYIPFPYWEIVYTVNPTSELEPDTVEVESTKGIAHSGISGSYSTAKPEFTIQVMDGDDPNRIVRTITPPGGIDLNLWKGIVSDKEVDKEDNTHFKTNQLQTIETETTTVVDPRPWTEKFYEGQRHYYFIVTAQSLDSYSIKIQIPTRYIGNY
ncbi:hypothetical protein [Methanoregula sp.]|uniref:hypothetical protein n=1 Tax=Methanoregula sp. TaxID=2052170 RepID=UPI002374D1BF|nr:hypothetical protein [Methanoregula sp.]MDD1687071.1 hypothetical protein [Methanoregula sp.]